MSKPLKSALQVIVSLALGFFLIWMVYKDLTEENKANIINSFKEANYWWILASTSVAVLSHMFRAYRWRYPLEALGIKISFLNRFAAVMIGYLANLAFPRLGEVSRCAVLARYQKQPFEKLFGTVIAERVVDLVILIALIITATLLQFPILEGFLNDLSGPIMEKVEGSVVLIGLGVIGLIVAIVAWKFIQESSHKIALAIREKITGLIDGFATLKNMDGQLGFYFQTFLIWGCYVLMFLLTFQSFPETAAVPFGGMLASFVLGGIAIVVVQGGLGAYPLAIMSILLLYGVTKDLGYAFGWIVWTAQTSMIILLGFLAVIVLPLINKTPATDES